MFKYYGTARHMHSTAQHGTCTARHSTAQHGTARHMHGTARPIIVLYGNDRRVLQAITWIGGSGLISHPLLSRGGPQGKS